MTRREPRGSVFGPLGSGRRVPGADPPRFESETAPRCTSPPPELENMAPRPTTRAQLDAPPLDRCPATLCRPRWTRFRGHVEGTYSVHPQGPGAEKNFLESLGGEITQPLRPVGASAENGRTAEIRQSK